MIYRLIGPGSQQQFAAEKGRKYKELLDLLIHPLGEGKDAGGRFEIRYDVGEASCFFKKSLYLNFTDAGTGETAVIRVEPADTGANGHFRTLRYTVGAIAPPGEQALRMNLAIARQVSELVKRNETSPCAMELYDELFNVCEIFVIYNHVRLKLTGRCNESCLFCNTGQDSPNFVPEASELPELRKLVGDIFGLGVRILIFTGGEPTLFKDFPDLVNHASNLDFERVVIETNGIALSSKKYLSLFRSGAKNVEWLVSLHSHREDVNDHLTGASGFFTRKIKALRNLLDERRRVRISFVVNRLNFREIEKFIAFIHSSFADNPPAVMFSFVSPSGSAGRNMEIVPRFTDAMPYLEAALAKAEETGIKTLIPERCGVPICLMKGYERFHEIFQEKDNMDCAFEKWELNPEDSDKMKFDKCGICGYTRWCTGVWKGYAAVHGTGEFSNILDNKPELK
ncbi:MAG: radical SAM protein [Deltaproteobacteria bacterium]|nr:radical SAM protein [Deltaproteobacteria bacterium]